MPGECNLAPQVFHQPTLLGGAENMKLLFDDTMAELAYTRKRLIAHDESWETLRLLQANNAAIASHQINMQAISAGQTGVTEQQAPTSPIRTGASDTQVQQPAGAVYPPIRNVDQSGATSTGAIQTAQAGTAVAAAGVATANQALADALAAFQAGIQMASVNFANAVTALLARATGTGAAAAGAPQPPSTPAA